MKKYSELAFDLFCFLSGSNKSKQYIISIATIAESPIVWICHIKRWKLLHLTAHSLGFFPLLGFLQPVGGTLQASIYWVRFSPFTLGVGWNQRCFNECIEFTQVNVCEYWTEDWALCG